MRRPGVILALCLALVASGAVPVAAARPDPTFSARASDARTGGVMRVVARVRHPQRGIAFSATAIVHFACGDAAVTLEPVGRGNRLRALVPVKTTELPGAVTVEIAGLYGDQPVDLSATGTVRTRRHAPPPPDCGEIQQDN